MTKNLLILTSTAAILFATLIFSLNKTPDLEQKNLPSTTESIDTTGKLPDEIPKTKMQETVINGSKSATTTPEDFGFIMHWRTHTKPNNVGTPFTTEYFLAHDVDLGIKAVYYTNKFHETPMIRFTYPDNIDDEEVFTILTAETHTSIEYDSGAPNTTAKIPGSPLYSTTSDSWNMQTVEYIDMKDECQVYRGGGLCEIEIYANLEGFVPGILSTSTSEYDFSGMSLSGIHSLGDGKILLSWGFGDAGAYSRTYSLWDTLKGTNTSYLSYGGLLGEFASISIGNPINKTYESASASMSGYGTTTSLLDINPFERTTLVGQSIKKEHTCLRFYPTDLTSLSNDIYIEYTNSCGFIGTANNLPAIAIWYKLNPETDELTKITEILPRKH